MNSMILNCKFNPHIFIINNLSNNKCFKNEIYQNILLLLEQHKIFIEFQCREGYCGSCRTQIIKGEVYYPHPPLACINKNEILPCCCFIAHGSIIELYISTFIKR